VIILNSGSIDVENSGNNMINKARLLHDRRFLGKKVYERVQNCDVFRSFYGERIWYHAFQAGVMREPSLMPFGPRENLGMLRKPEAYHGNNTVFSDREQTGFWAILPKAEIRTINSYSHRSLINIVVAPPIWYNEHND
jgi:hypothetical protein